MVITLRIKTNISTVQARMKNMGKRFDRNMALLPIRSARIARDSIRKQFIMQRKRAPRSATSRLIKARKIGRFNAVVTLPLKAHYLDAMRPHWVALKRGRVITKWARKYYTRSYARSGAGLSQVFRGPKGGILYKPGRRSALWVTPDPFVNRGIMNSRKRIINELQNTLRKSLRGG